MPWDTCGQADASTPGSTLTPAHACAQESLARDMAVPKPITWVQHDAGTHQPRDGTVTLLSRASNSPGKDTPVSCKHGCPLHQGQVASDPWFGDQLLVLRPLTHTGTQKIETLTQGNRKAVW